ncbi:conserved domain protein [Neorickettsia risticii str. Illinois]|nr:conserved domain protein [Neorickettsia risticii str. Illinois]
MLLWEGIDVTIPSEVLKMPKLKTNSSAKKRFKVTSTGKVMVTQSGKRHNMRKRNKRMLLVQKGYTLISKSKMRLMRSVMPYSF